MLPAVGIYSACLANNDEKQQEDQGKPMDTWAGVSANVGIHVESLSM
jgi:hypothetical protein